MTSKKHIPLPKDTKAFICANCEALSLGPTESARWSSPREAGIPYWRLRQEHRTFLFWLDT